MNRFCRFFLFAFALLYVAALCLLVIGTFGLFGSPRDPLAGVFLMPFGLPWNLLIDNFSSSPHPWLAAAAPLVNLLVIGLICRMTRSERHFRKAA